MDPLEWFQGSIVEAPHAPRGVGCGDWRGGFPSSADSGVWKSVVSSPSEVQIPAANAIVAYLGSHSGCSSGKMQHFLLELVGRVEATCSIRPSMYGCPVCTALRLTVTAHFFAEHYVALCL